MLYRHIFTVVPNMTLMRTVSACVAIAEKAGGVLRAIMDSGTFLLSGRVRVDIHYSVGEVTRGAWSNEGVCC